VYFNQGYTQPLPKRTGSSYVRAVRGGQYGTFDSLIINSDGTVTDTSTGLMWQEVDAGEMPWESALDYCEELNLAGYDDWRMPNKNDLQSLINYSVYSPSIDSTAFPTTRLDGYWSSTTKVYSTVYAWYVNFISGSNSGNQTKGSYKYVRAVRGGQYRLLDHLVILTPEQGDRWEVGSMQAITWETREIAGNVAITLSRDSGNTYETIDGSAPNDGTYKWYVTGPLSANCILKIVPADETSLGTTQGLFRIASATEHVAAVSGTPNDPTTQTTAALTVGGESIISYKYKLDEGEYSDEIYLPVAVDLADLSDGSHTVYVVGRDASGYWQSMESPSTVSWTVDTTPPDAPTGLDLSSEDDSGSSDTDNETQNTTGLTITGSGEEGAVFQLYDFGIDIYGATGTVTDGEFSIDISLAQGIHSIAARQTDAAGNTSLLFTYLMEEYRNLVFAEYFNQ